MKRIITLLALIVISTINAQAPQGFNYQATVRNSAGALITNQNVLLKFNIMLNSQTSLPVYSETHQAPTDDLGQVNLVIGTGTPTIGTFSSINWGNGTYYLGIELNTGSGFVVMGTTQLFSVPYALYANTAGNITGGGSGFTHYIGEQFGGGIIFHLWIDGQGVEHGLVVDKSDLSNSQFWSNIIDNLIGVSCQSSWDGLSNSNAIINQSSHTISAAKLCLDSNNNGQIDWYLPSIDELSLLWQNRFIVNKTLSSIGGNVAPINYFRYWSSTESNGSMGNFSLYFDFERGQANIMSKDANYFVRAVRSF
jgi:hypothetical protein